MMLFIDIGNSHLKWQMTGPGRAPTQGAQATATLNENVFSDLWSGLARPERVVVSDVQRGAASERLVAWCQTNWNRPVEFVRVEARVAGVQCGYKDIKQLGVDRWLAMLAAWDRYQRGCVIVDCGTATTLDIIDDEGQHQGGLIAPGESLMQQSLLTGTHGIDTTANLSTEKLADNTADAVANGCRYSVVGLINEFLLRWQREQNFALKKVITGGAAKQIIAQLPADFDHVEALVLDGIQVWVNAE